MTDFIGGFRKSALGDKAAEGRQSGANLLGTLARHPALTKSFLAFNGHILYGTSLSVRQREILVLRVAVLRHCGYEWAQHVILGREAGLGDAEVAGVIDGPDAPVWSPVDRALLRAVDDLLAGGKVGDDAWDVLAKEFDEQQLMDVIFTVGTYETVAFALRSFGVEPEADLAPHIQDRGKAEPADR
ncbi:carboxymuconolactone decarboxylase family protein [Yinghuangia sp. ASG 101]|uniref:carboxymuconolactone decarboxylase family protein n=1 Tax=Yinghuangia sp. ASG 101 TaxID=2896848 RepID=UPI001E34D66B|nr:carboxymuconolactone decarboxylase family protein [Yinghuangia sp. ASG 101]UGQ13804.1 carboxymuconolactone decarboxylase family protein [Yinghuangia sp. ASG 101]